MLKSVTVNRFLVNANAVPVARSALAWLPPTPDHPITVGFLCGKVSNYLDRVYSEERLLRPLVRTGAKGALEKPYRATGKSWTLDVGDAGDTLAMVDAFREEVLEAGSKAMLSQSRFAMRLSAKSRRDLIQRLEELADEFALRDEPGGEAVALYYGLHKRRRTPKR